MKNYIVKRLTEEFAKEICTWKYENEFAVYNFSDYDIVKKNGWDLSIKEKREAEYLSVVYNHELIAYGRITADCNKSIIGIGLKPVFCGKGYGKDIMKLLIEECKKRYPQYPITLEVRSFNKRAIKCYTNIGFEIKDNYIKDTLNGKDEFYYMEYSLNENMKIRKANIEDASLLSELAMRSKAYWGYDDNFIQACKDNLTISNKNITSDYVYLLEDAGSIIGFYCLVICGDIGELDAMFIEPKFIGKGYGKILYADIMQRAHKIGIKEFTIDADPHAEEFYKKMGAVRIGEVDSTVFNNRRLPLMKMFV